MRYREQTFPWLALVVLVASSAIAVWTALSIDLF